MSSDWITQMADALQRASALHSETVTYKRGETEAEISAIVEAPDMVTVDGEVIIVAVDEMRFNILVSALSDFGDPQRGDEIEYGSKTFEVLNTPGIGVFEYLDAGRTTVRVHTKRKD